MKICDNTSGGNCYFKSQFFNNTEKFHVYYRKRIKEYL